MVNDKRIELYVYANCDFKTKLGVYVVKRVHNGVMEYHTGYREGTTIGAIRIIAIIDVVKKLQEPFIINIYTNSYTGFGRIRNKNGEYKEIPKGKYNREELSELLQVLKDGKHKVVEVITSEYKEELKPHLKEIVNMCNDAEPSITSARSCKLSGPTKFIKPKKYYAIKVGNGVTDKIVRSWEDCKKYVYGYDAVYKSFTSEEEALFYLKTVNVKRVKEQKAYNLEHNKKGT